MDAFQPPVSRLALLRRIEPSGRLPGRSGFALAALIASMVLVQMPLEAQVRIPVDLTAGYLYNAPGARVPFRGGVTGSIGFRVAKHLMIGPAGGYVWADSTDAGIAGGQVDLCLLACLADLEVGLMGRGAAALVGTAMTPVSLGLVVTATAVRTGFLVTRDFNRDATALELIFGVELKALADVMSLFGGA